MTTVEKIEYRGWQNCYRISNAIIELIITTDIGPRIIHFGFVGGHNHFVEIPETQGQTGGDVWKLYGGHRFWHAPESIPRTVHPDNFPVELETHEGFVRVTQPIESTTGIQKQIDIYMDAHVKIVHRLFNHNLWAVELAPWALSVMAAGGTAIVPLPPRGTHRENLLPVNTVTMWAYTDMSDPRWTWGRQFVLLRQVPGAETPQKIGTFGPESWLAYAREGELFMKKATYQAGATYPDYGCSLEIFTNDYMLELETLGPLVKLQPGATVEHIEEWQLFRDVPAPTNDADVLAHIAPKLGQFA